MFLNSKDNFTLPYLDTNKTNRQTVDFKSCIKIREGPSKAIQSCFFDDMQKFLDQADQAEVEQKYEMANEKLLKYYSYMCGLMFANDDVPLEYKDNEKIIVFDYQSAFVNERIKFTNWNAERIMVLSRVYLNFYNLGYKMYQFGDIEKAKENFLLAAKVCNYIEVTLIKKRIDPYKGASAAVQLPPECDLVFNTKLKYFFSSIASICLYIKMKESSEKIKADEIKNSFNHYHQNAVGLYSYIYEVLPEKKMRPKVNVLTEIYLFTLQTRIIAHIYEARRIYEHNDNNVDQSAGILNVLKSNYQFYYSQVNDAENCLLEYVKANYITSLNFLEHKLNIDLKDHSIRCEARVKDPKYYESYDIAPNEKNINWKEGDEKDEKRWLPFKPMDYPKR